MAGSGESQTWRELFTLTPDASVLNSHKVQFLLRGKLGLVDQVDLNSLVETRRSYLQN